MSKHPANTYSLVADIGGTNTRVALAVGQSLQAETIRKYPNSAFDGLEAVLRRYIADEDGVDCAGACVALAGPVREGVGEMTNLDWHIDRATLARATGAEKLAILNDLQAQGHGLGHIVPDKINCVIPGRSDRPHAAKLVIGVGTGLNAAPVYDADGGRLVPPSECGHASLPVRTEQQWRLSRYIEDKYEFAGVEDVLSGRGLGRVYDWLGHEVGDPHHLDAEQIMKRVADGSDPRASEAAQVFVELLGCVVGNLALFQLPFGGIYLIGGVTRAMAPYFNDFGFDAAFRDKGRFAPFMDNFAVSVIEDDFAALTGCACHLAALP